MQGVSVLVVVLKGGWRVLHLGLRHGDVEVLVDEDPVVGGVLRREADEARATGGRGCLRHGHTAAATTAVEVNEEVGVTGDAAWVQCVVDVVVVDAVVGVLRPVLAANCRLIRLVNTDRL